MNNFTLKLKYRGQDINLDTLINWIVKSLFLLFIFFAAFGRNVTPFGLSGGLTSVLVAFALFNVLILHYLLFNRNKKFSVFFYLITLSFLYMAAQPLASFIIYEQKGMAIIRYSLELGVNFGMLFSVYYTIKHKLISPKFYLYAFAIFGVIITLNLLSGVFSRATLRRITGLGGALNYTGSVLAMCAVVWAMILYTYSRKKDKWLLVQFMMAMTLLFVILGLFLTATRAGLISLIVGFTLLQLLGMQSRRFFKYISIVGVVFVFSILIISMNVDLTPLYDRFTFEKLSSAALIRFELYANSVTDLTLSEFFFGRADFYTFDNEVSGARIVNTHNLFLSLIRYNGILSFILFLAILIVVFANYFRLFKLHINKPKYRLTESAILILLVMSLIYSMFSGGRSTKIFIVFIQLGFSIGYIELLRNVTSAEEYKKLIL